MHYIGLFRMLNPCYHIIQKLSHYIFIQILNFMRICISNQMKLKDSDIKKSSHSVDNVEHGFWTLRHVPGLSICLAIFTYDPLLSISELIFGQIYANMPNSESLSAKIWNSCSNVIQNSGNGVLNITFVYIIIMIWRFKIIQVQSFVLIK